jgi:hypothetical protein
MSDVKPIFLPSVHIPLEPLEGRSQRRSSQDDRIDPDKTYLALIFGEWCLGQFSQEWYGWSFDNWGTSGIQLDSIEDLYEVDLSALEPS